MKPKRPYTELDDRYVTKDACMFKKTDYMSKEMCSIIMKSITNDINEIKMSIKETNNKLDECMLKMRNDITEIKTILCKKNDKKVDKEIVIKFILLLTILGTIILILTGNSDIINNLIR